MKRIVILVPVFGAMIFCQSLLVWGAALLEEGFDYYHLGSRPGGWIFSNCNQNSDTYTIPGYYGHFGQGLPSIKLNDSGDLITTPSLSNPLTLEFWFRGYYAPCTSAFLIKRYDGLSWNQFTYITSIPGVGTTVGPLNLDPSTVKLQFSWWHGSYGCDLAFDDVLVTGGQVTPTPPPVSPSPTPIPIPTATRSPTPIPPPSASPTASPLPTRSPSPTPNFPAPGPIQGRVYDQNTGAGIGDVWVIASGTLGGKSTYSNSSGYYSISGLPVGEYRVHAVPPGQAPSNPVYVEQWYNRKYSMNQADMVATNSGLIDFPLVLGGSVSGSVTDELTGQGVPDVTIIGYHIEGEGGSTGWTRTDSHGNYSLRPFLTGYYNLYASAFYHNMIHPESCFDNQWFDRKISKADAEQVYVEAGNSTTVKWTLERCAVITPPTPPPTPFMTPTPGPSGTASPSPTITPPGTIEIWQIWSGIPGAGAYGEGAGQATLIREPASGTTVLYDCGAMFRAPQYAAARELLYIMYHQGIDHIDYLVTSHYDVDHCIGVQYLVNGTGQPEDPDLVRNGIRPEGLGVAYDRGGTYDNQSPPGPISPDYLNAVAGKRQTWTVGSEIDLGIPGGYARLKCLSLGNPDYAAGDPDLIYVFNRPDLTTGIDENAKSIVSLLSFGDFDMWLGGDATSAQGSLAPVEETVGDVIRNDLNKRVDILLVDHHGSADHTSTEFLQLIGPSCAFISIWNNSYNFPRSETLSRLEGEVECSSGRQSILQTSDGERISSICGFSARCHLHVETDSNVYTLTTYDADGRATSCQPITDANWIDHPVNREPQPTPPPERHMVISQMAPSGPGGGNDEFCELYNATDHDIDFGGWKLDYMTASGASRETIVTIPFGVVVPSYHYYLTAHTGYVGPVTKDIEFTKGLSDSGGHLIIVDNADQEWDRLGWGNAAQPEGQPVPTPNWGAGNTVMRKVSVASTAQSMCPGGSEYGFGNAWDSGNNRSDFVHQNFCNRDVIRNSNSGSWPPAPPTPVPYTMTRLVLDSGDYNGDGTSEIGIFRGSTGLWSIRFLTAMYFGKEYDLPVSGDYNGDGTADFGIFRGDTQLWSIRGVTKTYFGDVADMPIPGDYNGDGSCDIGIFRDHAGLWALADISRFYFGADKDEAVPADYNGDGTTEVAIFRSYYSLWSIRGLTKNYFGRYQDWPVPADYNGDGITEEAIFRSYYGLWSIREITQTYLGQSLDYPAPADYRGNGTDEIGIFRPPSGLWSIRQLTKLYLGTINDLPVTR